MVERKLHPHHFLSPEEKRKLIEAIQAAEKHTSGEIRIHLDRRRQGNVMDRAKQIFQRQRLHQRTDRNAVLIYLSLADRSFAIFGDEGLHQQVGDAWWTELAASMQAWFSRGQFLEGLEHAIHKIGERLKKHFRLDR